MDQKLHRVGPWPSCLENCNPGFWPFPSFPLLSQIEMFPLKLSHCLPSLESEKCRTGAFLTSLVTRTRRVTIYGREGVLGDSWKGHSPPWQERRGVDSSMEAGVGGWDLKLLESWGRKSGDSTQRVDTKSGDGTRRVEEGHGEWRRDMKSGDRMTIKQRRLQTSRPDPLPTDSQACQRSHNFPNQHHHMRTKNSYMRACGDLYNQAIV